jgi:NAD(P)-dependent dehydrogenase (short-subunit alcohol dehydrogenase family)
MELELTNRVAVVTGEASGIGAACVRAHAMKGFLRCLIRRDTP